VSGSGTHRLGSQARVSVRWQVDAGESRPCRPRGYGSVDVRARARWRGSDGDGGGVLPAAVFLALAASLALQLQVAPHQAPRLLLSSLGPLFLAAAADSREYPRSSRVPRLRLGTPYMRGARAWARRDGVDAWLPCHGHATCIRRLWEQG
jgi:hypothetical protein